MSMLVRAEDAYLNILRVVILVIATLAMIATIAGLAFGGWLFFKNAGDGGQHAPPVQQITLGDYVSEQKAAVPSDTSGAEGTSGISTSVTVPVVVDKAAKDIVQYGAIHNLPMGSSVSNISTFLNGIYQNIPSQFQSSYGESLDSLTHQLIISTGSPLSIDQLNSLLKWHAEKFNTAIGQDQSKRAGKAAIGLQLVSIGAGAFMAFLLIVFFFIFVKIERNLRIVKTLTRVEGAVQ